MTFADIPGSTAVFLDANTLVYCFTRHPALGQPSMALLNRIKNQEITGFTSTHVLCETYHRLMTLEAVNNFGWPQTGIAQRLRKNPTEVQKLTNFRQAIDSIPQLGIQVLTVPFILITTAAAISQQTGLLCNDALIVAVMQNHGVTQLASNDPDFDRIPGLARFAPA